MASDKNTSGQLLEEDYLKAIRDKEKHILDKVFKQYDAIENKEHLIGLVAFTAQALSSDDLPVFTNLDKSVNRYLAMSRHEQAFQAKNEKYFKLVEDCKNHLEEIISGIDDRLNVGLTAFRMSLKDFITDKTSNPETLGLSFRIGKSLLRDGDAASKVLAKSYPLETKYKLMESFPRGVLPYICYGVSPEMEHEDWIPRSFVKMIDDAKAIINSAIPHKLPTTSADLDKVGAREFASYIKTKREKDYDFVVPLPKWLEDKIDEQPDPLLKKYEALKKLYEHQTKERSNRVLLSLCKVLSVKLFPECQKEGFKELTGRWAALCKASGVKISLSSLEKYAKKVRNQKP
jgi:hypothetical protein